MLQEQDPPFRDLREYVEKKGVGLSRNIRKPGWLIRDLEMLLTEYDRLRAARNPKPKRSWSQVWDLFDRRNKK